ADAWVPIDTTTGPMTDAPREVLAPSGIGKHVDRSIPHVAYFGARNTCVKSGQLALTHHLIHLPLPIGRRTDHKCTRAVGVIAAGLSAEIDFDEITAPDPPIGRPVVRDCRIRARSNDELECDLVGAELINAPLQIARKLSF